MAIFDDDISGSGLVDLGSQRAKFALCRIDTIGWETRVLSHVDTDRVLRAGFIAFGYFGDAGDGTERHYWQPPFWLDWLNSEWLPPQTYASDGFQYLTSLRWGLSDGVTAHLWVQD